MKRLLAICLLLLLPLLVCSTYQPDGLPEWLTAQVPAPEIVTDDTISANGVYEWYSNTIRIRSYANDSTKRHEYGHAVWNHMTTRGTQTWIRRVTLFDKAEVGVWKRNPGEAFADAFVRAFVDSEHHYRSELPEPPAEWTRMLVWVYVGCQLNW